MTKRHFFVSDDLDDLASIEHELDAAGVLTPQMHVLTLDASGAAEHKDLHEVTSLMRRDLVHSTLFGAGIGVIGAALVLLLAGLLGWTGTAAGWMPWIFLAVIVLGFCTWEGGLWGIQEPHVQFRRFEEVIRSGRHVLFVDVEPNQKDILDAAIGRHPRLEPAGEATGAPHWMYQLQVRFRRLFFETLP